MGGARIVGVALLILLAHPPAQAQTGNVVFTAQFQYVLGDDDVSVAGERVSTLYLRQGTELYFANLDVIGHSVTSIRKKSDGTPLFDTGTKIVGEHVRVRGTAALAPRSYAFYCEVHPQAMIGTLVVLAASP